MSELAVPSPPCWLLHQPNGTATTPGRSRLEMPGREGERAAVVPDPDGVPVDDAPRRRVGLVQLHERPALERAVLGQVRVRGVEEAGVVLGREQGERVPGQQLGVTVEGLAGRRVGRERGVPGPGQRLARELDPPAGRGEAALGVGPEILGQGEAHEAPLPELLDVHVRERRRQQRLVGLVQLGLGEPHGAGQAPPQLGVGNALPQRSDGRLVPAHVQVTPRGDDVELLDLGAGREDDVGVARRVRHELLAHDAEEVLPLEALTGRARRWAR